VRSENARSNLISKAKQAMSNAHVPYSNFRVGAALESQSGVVYTGCNIENAAYTPSCCAERVAIFKAVSSGEKKFSRIAIIGDTETPIAPCGVCRQVMIEFFDNTTTIYLTNLKGDVKETNINELLPYAFGPEALD